MRKFFMFFIAAAGLMGFAAVAQAECSLDMAEVEQEVVVTDTTPIVIPDQSGG